jgi:hypothetical protein
VSTSDRLGNIEHCIASLVPARDLMCTRLGAEMVREQVVEPFGFVMVPKADYQGAVDARDELRGLLTEAEEFVPFGAGVGALKTRIREALTTYGTQS